MSDKIVNHFVLADGSTAKYSAEQLAGDVPEVVGIRTGYDGTVYESAGDAVRGQISNLHDDLKDFLQFVVTSYNTVSGQSHSSQKLIDVDIAENTTLYIRIEFDADNTSVVAPKFYYSDGTSVSKASVTVNNTYSYTESKGITGIGFYSGASLPTGKVTVYIYKYDALLNCPNEISAINATINSLNTGNGILATVVGTGESADELDKNATFYSFGTSNIPLNIPNGINQGNIVNFSGATPNRKIQILFDNINNKMYFRTKYNGLWQNWEMFATDEDIDSLNTGSGLFAYYIDSNTDANSFDKNMTLYSFGSSNVPANLPTGVQVGNLINLRGDSTAGRSAQILIDSQTNKMYFRAKSGGTWSSWSGTIDNQITLKKTASDTFSIYVPNENGRVVRYDYIHRTKTWDSLSYTDGNGQAQTATNVKSCDVWNNYYIYNDTDNEYIAQGHSNFIVNINDDVDKYCGDGHGNEVAISFYILADGNLIDISSMAVNSAVKCSSLRLIHRGNIYKVGGAGSNNNYADSYPLLDTSGNPINALLHYMEIQYEIGNRVTIDNKIVVKQNNLVFNECHGAMLECQFTDFDTVICNNEENTQNEVSDSGTFTVATGSTKSLANTAQRCNVVEMFGKGFYIRQLMTNDLLSDDTTNVVYFNKYTDRLKCYFQPVKTVNKSISGVTPDTFNVGDVIAVTDVREINI